MIPKIGMRLRRAATSNWRFLCKGEIYIIIDAINCEEILIERDKTGEREWVAFLPHRWENATKDVFRKKRRLP